MSPVLMSLNWTFCLFSSSFCLHCSTLHAPFLSLLFSFLMPRISLSFNPPAIFHSEHSMCRESRLVLKLLAQAPWDQPGFVRCRGNPHRQSPTGSGLCDPKEGDVCRVMCPQQSLSRQGRSKTTGGTLEEGAIWGFSDVYDVANILRGQKLDTFFPLLLTGYTFLFGVPSALLSC